jgi:hypothetical protein
MNDISAYNDNSQQQIRQVIMNGWKSCLLRSLKWIDLARLSFWNEIFFRNLHIFHSIFISSVVSCNLVFDFLLLLQFMTCVFIYNVTFHFGSVK